MPSSKPNFEINTEHLMPDVYSYPFPEVRTLLGQLSINQTLMINTLPATIAADCLAPYDFQPPLTLTERANGSLDLDELHLPIIERIRTVQAEQLNGLESFDYAYPNHGSSISMFTLMAEWKANGSLTHLAALEGEYEGYSAYADALQIPVKRYHELPTTPEVGEVWFISNPSALDGNWITDEQWQAFVASGHQIVYDAAYVGLTTPKEIDVTAPNIRAVLTSPSKIYGVFRHRLTGVAYTRDPVKALYGTKWFKDIPALLDTLKLYEAFAPSQLAEHYQPVQQEITRALSAKLGRRVIASDVLLLAHTATDQADETLTNFQRGNRYRFGLTKLFEDYERSID